MVKLLLTIWQHIMGLEPYPPVYNDRHLLQTIENITRSARRATTYWELEACMDGVQRLILERYKYEDVAEHVTFLSNLINKKEIELQLNWQV